MKHTFILLIVIIYGSYSYAQKDESFPKIDLDIINAKCLSDTNNFYTIVDEIKIDFAFHYNHNWVGALDGNFTMDLERKVRLKVNKIDSIDQANFLFNFFNGISNEVKIENSFITFYSSNGDKLIKTKIKKPLITIYSSHGDKLIKTKINSKEIVTENDSSSVFISLSGFNIPDSSIVEIKYEIQNLPKQNFKWILFNNNLIVKRQIITNIPEIYDYKIEYTIVGNTLKDISSKLNKKILIGYDYNGRLLPDWWYKILHERDPEFQAPEVYCRYFNNTYIFENLVPKKEPNYTDWFQLKLLHVNPIR